MSAPTSSSESLSASLSNAATTNARTSASTSGQSGDGLVRQHERVSCRMAAVSRVEPGSDQVVLSRASASGRGEGELGVWLVDVSPGGLGITSPLFFPRGTKLRVRLEATRDGAGARVEVAAHAGKGGGADDHGLLVRVQRCMMTDRAPTYYVGGSFVKPDRAAVMALMELAAGRGVAAC